MTKKNNLFRIIFAAVMIALVVWVICWILIPQGEVKIDKRKYPITGIDMSGHTGKIDFDKISKHSIDFIYLKATEGKTFVDRNFEQNYKNSRSSAIPVGFYHFFRFNRGGEEQAENFLNTINGKKTRLPLVLDVEEWKNAKVTSTKKVVTELKIFVRLVEARTGKRLMIYTNESSYNRFILGNFDKNDLWICSFSKSPNIDRKWTLWQHSHEGRFEGAHGLVDINTFNGSREEWRKYLNSR
ncbi:MAG TPA: GH25 family lysozyme [Chitinispirillaceae bacterium]|nr:GH25 family lysozyme [Chitinispirillaceae bacterium]